MTSSSSIVHPLRHRAPTWPSGSPHMRRQNMRDEWQIEHTERLKTAKGDQAGYTMTRTTLYIGIAALTKESGQVLSGLGFNDGTYSIDYVEQTVGNPNETVTPAELENLLSDHWVETIKLYEKKYQCKILGAGITKQVINMSPHLPSRLWSELDILPFAFERGLEAPMARRFNIGLTVDEEADSMARKCLMFFGPNQQPRVMVGYRNEVEVDANGHIQMITVDDFRNTVDDRTWTATMTYVESLKKRGKKIAFFNSTPQGGGVALMRHALIRFFRAVGVDCRWYVPKPKPEAFRITKNNHNILQGVADSKERLTLTHQKLLEDWANQNAHRFWLSEGGPLRPRSEGGADVIVVDDPQMPGLVTLAKEADPDRPVIFRSHIQIRSDLVNKECTPASEVWQWIWSHVKLADVFISHPVREFIPNSVDFKKVAYMPATTDWLDGLNKELNLYDSQYYIHEVNTECCKQGMTQLAFPRRDYIVQIARFDPSKGIPDVLASYAELRRHYMKETPHKFIPQLVIAGHAAIDDPDGSLVYDQTLQQLEDKYSDIKDDVVVLRLGPTDQLLNVLMSNAKIALQLSTREGFEIKVSEALHKGIPIIATKAGGIPLQVIHSKSGFLVEPSDFKTVAKYLHELFTDKVVYAEMSSYAASHVSPEVSTVGNALAWMFLADTLANGHKLEPDSAWVNDLARDKAGVRFVEGVEVQLPRHEGLDLTTSKKQKRERRNSGVGL